MWGVSRSVEAGITRAVSVKASVRACRGRRECECLERGQTRASAERGEQRPPGPPGASGA